jgi:hypothetical protein
MAAAPVDVDLADHLANVTAPAPQPVDLQASVPRAAMSADELPTITP